MKGGLLLLDQQSIAINFATECVGNNICLTRMILETHVVIFEQLQPPPLPKVQIWLGEQILQALVVGVDFTAITDEVMTLYLQSIHYDSQL